MTKVLHFSHMQQRKFLESTGAQRKKLLLEYLVLNPGVKQRAPQKFDASYVIQKSKQVRGMPLFLSKDKQSYKNEE